MFEGMIHEQISEWSGINPEKTQGKSFPGGGVAKVWLLIRGKVGVLEEQEDNMQNYIILCPR